MGLIILALAVLTYFVIPSASEESPKGESVVVLSNGAAVVVDIADDMFEREKGLSGRESLEADEGLLFLHDELEYQRYWMKDMLIPIDILWIDGERVVGFVQDAQPE
ncbi:DUF192 domain-containing protein, partial [Candidatus Uhrbacteria bacterium]|nr:DUF192 domain-containing protein [Candidatus Uhrbacteria bacterium]